MGQFVVENVACSEENLENFSGFTSELSGIHHIWCHRSGIWKSLRWMSTLRSGRVYKKMERDQDDRLLDRVAEDSEEGDGNEEENGGGQHGGADGAGAIAQML